MGLQKGTIISGRLQIEELAASYRVRTVLGPSMYTGAGRRRVGSKTTMQVGKSLHAIYGNLKNGGAMH